MVHLVQRGLASQTKLERYGIPERVGDRFWMGTVRFAESTDDDGIPDEWRPYLPAGVVSGP